ncbi:MAG: hypothetical protein QXH97_00285 [Candidatus Bathyarchaeia archaeon]
MSEKDFSWLDERLIKLLKGEPWLLTKLRGSGGVALVCLEYWKIYEGLRYQVQDFDRPLTSPETIARRLRYLSLSKEKLLKNIEKQKTFGLAVSGVSEDEK